VWLRSRIFSLPRRHTGIRTSSNADYFCSNGMARLAACPYQASPLLHIYPDVRGALHGGGGSPLRDPGKRVDEDIAPGTLVNLDWIIIEATFTTVAV
jgi:hypothetical protein